MTDRLAELGKDLVIEEEEVDQQPPTQALPDDLIELQKREVLIKKDIERLRTYAEDIAKLVPTDDSSRDALTPLLSEFRPVAAKIRKDLEAIRNENSRLASENTVQGRADLKMRQNIHTKLMRTFVETLKELNDAQVNYKKTYIEKVTRTAKIVTPDITEQTIEEIVERGDAENLFADKVLAKRKQEAAENLVLIQAQYRDLTRLHESIVELHQIFIDMDTIVTQQGEMMNHIEDCVNSSVQYAGEAISHAEKAERYNKAGKRRCACCAGGVAGVMALTGAGLAAALMSCTIM